MPHSMEHSILIVDDDPDAGQNLGDILVDLGYRVEVATDGFMALELARIQTFQIALLDFKMPGMDGLTLASKLRELSCSMAVILTTAYANRDTVAAAPGHGIWKVFSKPLDLKQMIPCLVALSEQPVVLIVDDDRDLSESLADVLQDKGYRTFIRSDVNTALACLRGSNFQVVVLDMKLPGGFGDDVFRQLRRISQNARVILMTGHRHEMEDRIRQSLDAGADAVCYKPFDVPDFLDTLGRLATSTPA